MSSIDEITKLDTELMGINDAQQTLVRNKIYLLEKKAPFFKSLIQDIESAAAKFDLKLKYTTGNWASNNYLQSTISGEYLTETATKVVTIAEKETFGIEFTLYKDDERTIHNDIAEINFRAKSRYFLNTPSLNLTFYGVGGKIPLDIKNPRGSLIEVLIEYNKAEPVTQT